MARAPKLMTTLLVSATSTLFIFLSTAELGRGAAA